MSSNKTIAKNSLFLYFRMFLTMGVGLYTSRLVLDALGVVDYGIYGLVGGIVTMFAFLNSAMASATQRYLSYDIGKNDFDRLRKTFSATLTIHVFIAIVALILAETIGLWFVNTQLNIPSERMRAANWVYQFSVFSFLLGIIQVPYSALIVAREHMKIYAYMGIVETVLKLLLVFLLFYTSSDRLILYGILTFVLSLIVRLAYQMYCRRSFQESKYFFYFNRDYFKELISYSGWNLFGQLAVVIRNQGGNILLNLFYGPILNASFILSAMVQGIMLNFVANFQTAINPQIFKTLANDKKEECLNLIFKGSKLSFFLMLIIIMPILYNTYFFVDLWLGKDNVPDYAVPFIQLSLIYALFETTSISLATGIHATGKIRIYQICISILLLSSLPITWYFLKLFDIPAVVFYILISISFLLFILRLFFLKALLSFKLSFFFKEVGLRLLYVGAGMSFLWLFKEILIEQENLFMLVIKSSVIMLFTIMIVWSIGLNKNERGFMKNWIFKKI